MVSFRTFIRTVKDITDDKILHEKVKQYDPKIKIKKSGVRALQEVVIKEIPALGEKSTIEILKMLNVLVPAVSAKNTVQNVYVQIRKAIKLRWGEDSNVTSKAYTAMQYDRESWRKDREIYNQKVNEKNKNKRVFDKQQIFSIMDKIKNLEAPNYIDLAIGCCLASGSRIGEVLSFAEYSKSKEPHYILQKGILKSKSRTEIVKPVVHYTVEEFLSLHKKLRNMVLNDIRKIQKGDMTHYDFSQTMNSKINTRIGKYFNDKSVNSHDLRKIYASLAYDIYADKSKVSESSFLSEILGHQEGSSVHRSYSVVGVVESKKEDDSIEKDEEKQNTEDMVVPRNIKRRDFKSMERLAETVRILELKGMTVSNKILRDYGYGALVVSVFMKSPK